MKRAAGLLLFLVILGLPARGQTWTLTDGESRVINTYGQRVLAIETRPESASGTLTGSGQPLDTETVTIGATVYTGETGALDADYKFKIGATLTLTLAALCNCINGDDDGATCDSGTAAHPTVTCTGSTATTLTVEAITPGSGANTIATTETLSNNAWGDTTLVDVDDPVCNVSPADSAAAVAHTFFVEEVTDTEPMRSVVEVTDPYYFVDCADGDALVKVVP